MPCITVNIIKLEIKYCFCTKKNFELFKTATYALPSTDEGT